MTGLAKKLATVKSFLQEKFSAAEGPRGRFFLSPQYPFQFADPVDSDYRTKTGPLYLGELRGFYPDINLAMKNRVALGFFQPFNSMRHTSDIKNSTVKHRKHSGVDIFAPYLPYPHEVPVYALVSGTARVWTRDRNLTAGDYQKLGNRVRLFFDVPYGETTLKCAFDYGHLARFAPGLQPTSRSRNPSSARHQITAGDLVGYAGKSGNADESGESTTRNSPFRVNSGHVHLGFVLSDANRDPLDVLPKALALHPDQGALNFKSPSTERNTRIKIAKWDEDEQPTLREKQLDIDISEGLLATYWSVPLARRLNRTGKSGAVRQSRAILAKPFSPLDFDHSRSLGDTLDAYSALLSRSDKQYGDGFRKHRYVVQKQGDSPETDRWHETVWALTLRAQERADAMTMIKEGADPSVQPKNAGAAVLALGHLVEAAWMLFGGPAFAEATKGQMQPACGFGVFGEVRALAMPQGVIGIHRSAHAIQGAKGKRWVLSLTFGSGSLRHAVLSEGAVDAVKQKAYKGIRSFVRGLEPALVPTIYAYDLAYRRFRALRLGEREAVKAFKAAILEAADAQRLLAVEAGESEWGEAEFKSFAKLMARHNKMALEWSLEQSNKSEPKDSVPLSPEVKGIGFIASSSEEAV